MTKKPRENRIPIMMSDDELSAIEDWRFDNRIATRSDAVRRLCKMALVLDDELKPLHKSMSELIVAIKDVIGAVQPFIKEDSDQSAILELTVKLSTLNIRMVNHKNTLRHVTGQAYNFKSNDMDFDEALDESNDLKSFFKELFDKMNDSENNIKIMEDMLAKLEKDRNT